MVLRGALALILGAVLAACAPEAPSSAGPQADVGESAPGLTPDSATPSALSWTATGAGELALRERDGSALLTLRCAGGVMTAIAPGFQEVASEERFSLGADDQVFILVAQLGQERGVRAEGPPSQSFLDRLPSANAVQANYGAQNLGPHIPPSPEQAWRFVSACRS